MALVGSAEHHPCAPDHAQSAFPIRQRGKLSLRQLGADQVIVRISRLGCDRNVGERHHDLLVRAHSVDLNDDGGRLAAGVQQDVFDFTGLAVGGVDNVRILAPP